MNLGRNLPKDSTPRAVILRYQAGGHKPGSLVEYPTWKANKLIADGIATAAPALTLKRAKKG